MTDTGSASGDRRAADPMAAVDRKLNVFALANGMDLVPKGDARVLGWFRDGLERQIRVEPGAVAGTWALRAAATRDARVAGAESVHTLESTLTPDQIQSRFTELLAGATEAANAIRAEEVEGRG